MAKDPPSQGHSENFRERAGAASGRFWRNVTFIALAHVALIAGLIRWSVAARASTNAESIVWLGGAEDLATAESENQEPPSVERESPPDESKSLKDDRSDEEKPLVTTAKSAIELQSPTPTPSATPTPRPKITPTPTPKPKTTPKALPKATPKKTLVAKTPSKALSNTKSSAAKSHGTSDKKEKPVIAKTGSASHSSSGKTGPNGKVTSAGGGTSASEFGWYGHMLHDRFYSAWIQPTANIASGAKISTLVKVRIEKDGRVSKFEIINPSQSAVVNESVATVAKRVTEVDAPPTGLAKGDHYDVKINFELNTEQGVSN